MVVEGRSRFCGGVSSEIVLKQKSVKIILVLPLLTLNRKQRLQILNL
jgi:hypothetical protein